jgi:hypothetical protein
MAVWTSRRGAGRLLSLADRDVGLYPHGTGTGDSEVSPEEVLMRNVTVAHVMTGDSATVAPDAEMPGVVEVRDHLDCVWNDMPERLCA